MDYCLANVTSVRVNEFYFYFFFLKFMVKPCHARNMFSRCIKVYSNVLGTLLDNVLNTVWRF